jgi:dTDP-4-amino-4,6-dideoxygalactose transaminase
MASGKSETEDRFASGYHGDEVTMKGKTGRYTNYQARLGLLQMERQDRIQERRRANARRLLDGLRGTILLQEPAGPEVEANFMLVAGLFENLPRVASELLRRGIDTKHKYMRDCSGLFKTEESFPNAERAEREVLHLPAHPELSPARIDEIARIVREVVASLPAKRPAQEREPVAADR